MKVVCISYLNSLPYRRALAARGASLEVHPPRLCGEAFRHGRIDAALVPVLHAQTFIRYGLAETLGDFGIAVSGETKSTFLLGPSDLTDRSYRQVAADQGSSSAAALTRLLLEHRFGHRTVSLIRAPGMDVRPRLIIGDAAIRASIAGDQAISGDVGHLWQEWTGLPFTFARWVARPGLPSQIREPLLEALEEAEQLLRGATDSGVAGRCLDWIDDAAPDFPYLDSAGMMRYLARFRYALTAQDLAGEATFLEMIENPPSAAHGLAPSGKPSFWHAGRASIAFQDPPCLFPARDDRELWRKVLKHQSLSRTEIGSLLTDMPAAEMFRAAHDRRLQIANPQYVTYVVDSNPNYSNICDTNCSFCAFYRPTEASDGAYQHSIDEMLERFRSAVGQGATTILLQGGHHPTLPLSYYVELIERVRELFPHVTPHFFSAGEILRMAELAGIDVSAVLAELVAAGQTSLPGGGAEILSDRVRKVISPLKASADAWIDVHRQAHRAGMSSTATMMYGHVEAPSDIAEHLERIQALQQETGGFTAFIPWSFKQGSTPLGRRLDPQRQPGPGTYLRIIAAARLALNNVPHIQGSFFSEGWDAGEASLHCGADDVGGVLLEENVHRAAGYRNPTPLEDVQDHVRRAGFLPLQRDTHYRIISTQH